MVTSAPTTRPPDTSTGVVPPGGVRRRSGLAAARRRRQTLIGWTFALPFVLIFGVFMVLPLVSSFLMSFTDFTNRDVRTPLAVDFVGVEQYVQLFSNETFVRSMINTAYFVLVGIPLAMVAGLVLAVALNSGITRFRAVFRVGFYAPVVTSIVAVAVVWSFILQSDGLLNTILGWVGISGPDWLNSTVWAMPSLIVMAVWRNMGTLMIIFLAGLQGIPEDLLEAAEIDGAGPVRRFFSVTLPLLRRTLLVGAILLSVGFLQFFEEPFVMTEGGPLGSTLSVTYFTYNQFGFGDYGLAASASYVLFVAIALLSLVQFRTFRAQD
jgi:multiple sugar transport system permease protein